MTAGNCLVTSCRCGRVDYVLGDLCILMAYGSYGQRWASNVYLCRHGWTLQDGNGVSAGIPTGQAGLPSLPGGMPVGGEGLPPLFYIGIGRSLTALELSFIALWEPMGCSHQKRVTFMKGNCGMTQGRVQVKTDEYHRDLHNILYPWWKCDSWFPMWQNRYCYVMAGHSRGSWPVGGQHRLQVKYLLSLQFFVYMNDVWSPVRHTQTCNAMHFLISIEVYILVRCRYK